MAGSGGDAVDIYVRTDPVGFKEQVLDACEYAGDDAVRAAFDRLLLQKLRAIAAQSIDGAQVVDVCCSYGNATLACVRGMGVTELRENWADAARAREIAHARRFPARVTGVDLSANALQYGMKAGVFDASVRANLNTDEGLDAALPALRAAHLLLATHALPYLAPKYVERLADAFAQGSGPGYCLVSFPAPFGDEKTDAIKRALLAHLEYVGGGAAHHRRMTAEERGASPDFGDWVLTDVWVLKRRSTSTTPMSPPLRARTDPCRPVPLDGDGGAPPPCPDVHGFNTAAWGVRCIHVGVHDDGVAALPEPARVRAAAGKAREKLLTLAAPKPGARVLALAAADGGVACAIARLGAFVSCVEGDPALNAAAMEGAEQAGLKHLVAVPRERDAARTGEHDASFDIVVAEGGFGGDRPAAIAEAARVLKERGYLIFSDVMQADGQSAAGGTGRATVAAYREWAEAVGLHFAFFDDMSWALEGHYRALASALRAKQAAGALHGLATDGYVAERLEELDGLRAAAEAKRMQWGFFIFRKPREYEAPRAPRYKQVPQVAPCSPHVVREALVCASGRPSGLDSHHGPKSLVRLGDLPVICHALVELHHAGVRRAVVLCGYQGAKVEAAVARFLPERVTNGADALRIEYVHDAEYLKGAAMSSVAARAAFPRPHQRVLFVMGDHIYDPQLIQAMMVSADHGVGHVTALVELDCEGMVGLPATALKVGVDKTDLSALKIRAAGETLPPKETDGVEAGLYAIDTTFFDRVEARVASGQAYVSMGDVVSECCDEGKAHCVATDGRMWFGLETRETLAYAVRDGLQDIGTEDKKWLSDGAFDPEGKPLWVIPWGQGAPRKAAAGESWKEFSVDQWHSAVYVTNTFFADLFKDTVAFLVDLGKQIKMRGARCSLVEVGCGTGDFLRPVAPHFRTSIGVDFNANFVEYCNRHVPPAEEGGGRMQFVLGDACELVDLLRRKAPAHIWQDTRIVCCLGNTMGIIPDQLKDRIYHQMAAAAGEDGVVVLVYWNARCFGDACQNFYHANPALCGPFDGSAVDFATATLQTPAPASYHTHWTSVREARATLARLGWEEITVEERGKGVLVAARRLPS